jgi:hypothetical protein
LEMREKSNRTFQRIAASLPPHVAHRYGHQTRTERSIEGQLKEAVESQNWDLVRTLSAKLAERDRQAG